MSVRVGNDPVEPVDPVKPVMNQLNWLTQIENLYLVLVQPESCRRRSRQQRSPRTKTMSAVWI